MTTLENMSDGLIPFPLGFFPILEYSKLAAFTVATLSSLLIIIALLKAGPYQDSKFLLSLCIADLLYSAHLLILKALSNYYGAFPLGKIGCAVSGGFIFATAGSAIYSLAAMAVNLYLVLIKRVYMSDSLKDAIIIGFWIFLIALPASFLATDFRFKGMSFDRFDVFISNINFCVGVGLSPSGDYCFLAFWSSDPLVLLANYAVIFCIVVAFAIIAYVYTNLVQMYISTMTRKAEEPENRKHILSDNEKKLIYKSVAICAAFSLSWYDHLVAIAILTLIPRI